MWEIKFNYKINENPVKAKKKQICTVKISVKFIMKWLTLTVLVKRNIRSHLVDKLQWF